MAAASALSVVSRCRKLSRGIFKAAILLGMCGGIYPLSILHPEDSSPAVFTLTKENFDRMVTYSSEPWIVNFYAPWCGHCMTFAAEYNEIGERLKGVANVGKVNVQKERTLAQKYRIKSLPKFCMFLKNKTVSPLLYRGPRTADDIVRFVSMVVENQDDQV